MAEQLSFKKPFDAHVHFRQGAMLRAVAPVTARSWSRAIVMPNTEPPIETIEQAIAYKKEILATLPRGTSFEPLMTFYLTKNLSPADIEKGAAGDICKIHAVKYYPRGATTNSEWGYRNIFAAKDVLEKMEGVGMPLLLHGEVHVDESGNEIDPYEGERRFIDDILPRLLGAYPKLKVSLEHLSTAAAANFIEKHGVEGRLVATVTPHHLLFAREDIEGEPHLTCKPLIKSRADRGAIRALVTRGLPFVYAGTDSAPHPESKKRSGAFGVFSAPVAIELYAQVFDELGCLEKLEHFLSIYGPTFYRLAPSAETTTLEKKDWRLADATVADDGTRIIPMTGNDTVRWLVT